MYEIKNWKDPFSLTLETGKLSDREPFSREINEEYGEGGGLNADYRTVEAVAVAANMFGCANLVYGRDFIFKTKNYVLTTGVLTPTILFDFSSEETKITAEKVLYAAKI